MNGRSLHAAVIGIDRYADGIAPLRNAVRDASGVADVLETDHGYRAHRLLDDAASLSGVRELIHQVLPAEVRGEDDALLFYFAGHGFAREDENRILKGFLLPQTARPSQESTWLSMDELRTALEELPCRHLLIVLDCCFAGSIRWAAGRNIVAEGKPLYEGHLQHYLRSKARQVLTSAAHNETALDFTPPGRSDARSREDASDDDHSPFARALIEGLQGKADSRSEGYEPDGVVTATELYLHVQKHLVVQGFQTPSLAPLDDDSVSDYVFLTPGSDHAPRPDPRLDQQNNPWLALNAYSSDDGDRFFGRENAVRELEKRVRESTLVMVVGASGAGKSSVVRAGLIPRLRRPEAGGPWADDPLPVTEMRRLHRGRPVRLLENALARLEPGDDGARRGVVVIDQFEEIFTQCSSGERGLFLDRLQEVLRSPSLRLVLTVRSDFEPRVRALPDFRERIHEALFPVTPPSPEELEQIIEGPARLKALFFEDQELIHEIRDRVSNMPGALPMLSFALSEMYRKALERWDPVAPDRMLSRADYEAVGGVVGSLHARATDLWLHSSSLEKRMIRWMFLRSVSQESDRIARKRVSRLELRRPVSREDEGTERDENVAVDRVLERYVDARLLVKDDEYYEPAHDSLVLAWPKLLSWLEADRRQSSVRGVWAAAEDWQRLKAESRDSGRGLLWSEDPRLSQLADLRSRTERWRDRFSSRGRKRRLRQVERKRRTARYRLNALELAFIDAGAAEYHRRRRRLRRTRVTVSAVLFALLAAGLLFFRHQSREFKKLAETAQSRLATSQASTLLKQGNVSSAGLVALEIENPERDAGATSLLHEILRAKGVDEEQRLASLPVAAERAAWSPDGSRVALFSSPCSETRVWRPWSSEEDVILIQADPTENLRVQAWHPGGESITALDVDSGIHEWREGELSFHRTGAVPSSEIDGEPIAVDWHPKGDRLLVAYPHRLVILEGRTFRAADRLILESAGKEALQLGPATDARWAPDGAGIRFLRGAEEWLWDGASPSAQKVGGPTSDVPFDARSPGGRWLVRIEDGRAVVRDLHKSMDLLSVEVEASMKAALWSPRPSYVLTLSERSVDLWGVSPRLVQGLIRSGYSHCLTPTERVLHLQETADEAARRSYGCERCVSVFFETLEPDPLRLETAWSTYRGCLDDNQRGPWRPPDAEIPVENLAAETPRVCRVRDGGDVIPGRVEATDEGYRCRFTTPTKPAPEPSADAEGLALAEELGISSRATPHMGEQVEASSDVKRDGTFEILQPEGLRWVPWSPADGPPPLENLVVAGRESRWIEGHESSGPTYLCAVLDEREEPEYVGTLVDGGCRIALPQELEAKSSRFYLSAYEPRSTWTAARAYLPRLFHGWWQGNEPRDP